ncbi:MAG: tRNA glutamyl-Q(34) synthetase GluQRS [Pseudomonadota bacterium]
MVKTSDSYRGRFAPSPTGPLHAGSLVAACASYLEARTRGGEWLVRMEDLDPPREMPGAADDVLRTLEAFGFEWDGEVLYQSRHHDHYAEALRELERQDVVYACGCSRREIADSSVHGIEGPVYPGTCRGGLPAGRGVRAWRVRTTDEDMVFEDGWQGRIERNLARDYGDFVVKRTDGFWAYQLAVVVDDADQGITHVVRGADLLESTPRQIHLQRLLGFPAPLYAHCTVVTNAQGEKLSKQTGAVALDARQAVPQLLDALGHLGQTLPGELRDADLDSLWGWAIANWAPGVKSAHTALEAE